MYRLIWVLTGRTFCHALAQILVGQISGWYVKCHTVLRWRHIDYISYEIRWSFFFLLFSVTKFILTFQNRPHPLGLGEIGGLPGIFVVELPTVGLMRSQKRLTTWPLSFQIILLFPGKNQFITQYLTVAMIFCMKLLHLNGKKEHFLLSFMMVYTVIGILFLYSSIHL